jgi:1-acyl-sn-glycerol-3-phosphate acyltransferase
VEQGPAVIALATYVAVVVFLVWRSMSRSELGPSMWMLYIIERLFCGLMMRWRANNPPTSIPQDGPVLIVSNHRSPADPMFLWMNIEHGRWPRKVRTLDFMMASEYDSIPVLGWLTRTMNAILVDRDGQDMAPTREAIRRIKNGRIVALFPEGGINLGTDLMEPNPGIAFLALKAKVPVHPIFIHGAPQAESMITPFLKRVRVRVTYGEPIDLSEFHGQRLNQEKLANITNLIMKRLADLGGVSFTPVSLPAKAAS